MKTTKPETNPDNTQKAGSMTHLVRLACDCGADMVILNSGKIICGETARRFESLHRQTIIRDIGRAQACCDCDRSRRKNAGAPSLEPDYETHAKCPECGEPWSKIILPNVQGMARRAADGKTEDGLSPSPSPPCCGSSESPTDTEK